MKKIKLFCLLLASVLLLGCFAGCAPQAEEAENTAPLVLPGTVL